MIAGRRTITNALSVYLVLEWGALSLHQVEETTFLCFCLEIISLTKTSGTSLFQFLRGTASEDKEDFILSP